MPAPEKKVMDELLQIGFFFFANVFYSSAFVVQYANVQDPRLEGGYESVPTRDIHMKQIGFEPGWLHFLQHYVQPLQQRVYEGYWNDVRLCFCKYTSGEGGSYIRYTS